MHSYLDEHQRKAVEALFELKRICDKHDIRFYLLAGTTLGAVREKGMIAWDDDVDVGLLPEDLRRLQAVIEDELDPQFQYVSPETEPGFPRLFGKILHDRRSCIDLFPIARWTTHDLRGSIHWYLMRFCVESYYRSIGYAKPADPQKAAGSSGIRSILNPKALKSACGRILCLLCSFLRPEDYIRLARWNEDYFGRHGYDCYVNLYSIYGMKKERIKKEWIEETSCVTFEGGEFTTVGDTDAYLTHLYGDYMTPPPIEKRVKARHAEVYPREM